MRGKPARPVREEAAGKRTRSTPGTSRGGPPHITRFAPLLDQIPDLHGVVITADALHCQREHVAYLAERGVNWILTVKGNQPNLRHQLAALPGGQCLRPTVTPAAAMAAGRSAP